MISATMSLKKKLPVLFGCQETRFCSGDQDNPRPHMKNSVGNAKNVFSASKNDCLKSYESVKITFQGLIRVVEGLNLLR